jgi:hypothetical protein
MDRNQAWKIALRMSDTRGDDTLGLDVSEMANVLMASAIADMPAEVVSATLDLLKSEFDRVTPRILVRACRERPVLLRRPALPPPEDESGPAFRRVYFPERPNGHEPFPVAEPNERERERMRVFYAASALPATVVSRPDLGIHPEHIAQANAQRERAIEILEDGLKAMDGRTDELEPHEREIARDAQRRLDGLRFALGDRQAEASKARRLFEATLVRLAVRMASEGSLRCAGCGKRELSERGLAGAVRALMEAAARGATTGHVYCEHCRTGTRPAAGRPDAWLDPEVGLAPEELERLMREEASDADPSACRPRSRG